VIAVWEVSGAVRGAMGALNRVYGRDDTRSFWRRMGISIILGLVVSVSFAVAIGALGFGHELAARITSSGWGTALSVIIRIGIAGLAAFVGVACLIRWGTSKRHSAGWLGFVSFLVVALWIAATFILTWYFRSIVDYRSVFGTVASFIVLLIYLYWISISVVASPDATTGEAEMDKQVSWIIELAVKPGQLENFRGLMNEMVESTEPEPDTLSYDWFVSDDGSTVHIYERYADSDALVAHITGFKRKFAERFMTMVDATRFVVYGEPNKAARDEMEPFGPEYLGTFGGFVR
jgi:quinol monooxygenase YgiN